MMLTLNETKTCVNVLCSKITLENYSFAVSGGKVHRLRKMRRKSNVMIFYL